MGHCHLPLNKCKILFAFLKLLHLQWTSVLQEEHGIPSLLTFLLQTLQQLEYLKVFLICSEVYFSLIVARLSNVFLFRVKKGKIDELQSLQDQWSCGLLFEFLIPAHLL